MPSGSVVKYALTHPDDFENQSQLGEFVVTQSGTTELKLTPHEDYKIEGTETITLSLIDSNFGGTQWKDKSISVEIIDSSRPSTYTLESSKASVNEGENVTITLKTTNVLVGTEVTYVLTNPSALGLSSYSGVFVIDSSRTASVTFKPTADFRVDGEETFSLELLGSSMKDGGDGWKNQKIEVKINDTSVPTPTPTSTSTSTPTKHTYTNRYTNRYTNSNTKLCIEFFCGKNK